MYSQLSWNKFDILRYYIVQNKKKYIISFNFACYYTVKRIINK